MYRCAAIERKAYGTYPSNEILFPGPFPADVLVARGEELEAQCEEPSTFFFKVVDTDREEKEEEILAFSKWLVCCPCSFYSLVGRG